MINATDLKNGTAFLHYDKPYQVIKYNLIKLGRGSAYVKITARNLETGGLEEISYQSNAAVDEVNTYKKKLQYLYKDPSSIVFMDPKTYEQVEIPVSVLDGQEVFLKEGDSVDILFWSPSASSGQASPDTVLSIELPPKVVLEVAQTDPGVKGNSATNIYKPATLENGLKVKVPLFIKVGEKIRVDTRTKEYIERAN